jgi:hypothetical protein
LVAWKRPAGEVVRRGVPRLDHDRRLNQPNVDKVNTSRGVGRDIDLRCVDSGGSRLVRRWLHARGRDSERDSKHGKQECAHGRKGIARTEVAQATGMPDTPPRPRAFLISPATAHGPRALSLRRPESNSPFARRLREEGVPLGDVFSFLSGLYFRGKLEYARTFARSHGDEPGVRIITMTDGLVSPDALISRDDLERYATCADGASAAVALLEQTAIELSDRLGADADVVLLGSVSTGKYTDLLGPIFGARLLFPRDVLHIGQLARGALFLQRARDRRELEYMSVSDIVRAGRRASIRSTPAPTSIEREPPEIPSRATRPNTPDARADSPR